MEETSSSDDQPFDPSVSDEEEYEGQEDEFSDASSHPLVRLMPSTSADLITMNHDQTIDQPLNSDSYRPSRAMIDELLGRGSSSSSSISDVKQYGPMSESGEDLFAAAGRHYRQPDSGHQGFFQ